MSIRVGIVGISGFGGGEAMRLVASHPSFELIYAAGEGSAGSRLVDRFPGVPADTIDERHMCRLNPNFERERLAYVRIAPHRRSRRPGSAPVWSPRSITATPLTITVSIPLGYWCGSS